MPNDPTLFALLVAINHYPNLPPKAQLSGPLTDVQKIESYLQQESHKAKFSKVLLRKLISPANKDSELPSKANIVKGFTEFLCQAKAGDTVLFYYSGHGIREETNIAAFQREEIDGHIASITAYDINLNAPNTGQSLLSDKELRYLIRQLAHDEENQPKAHVLTIFDCCHSGENTRSPETPPADAKVRQIVRQAIPCRKKEDFIFYADPQIAAKLEAGVALNDILELGDHVMLSACREVELAWEYGNTGGAFTSALLDILKSHDGSISYQDLHTRILNRMRFYHFKGQEQRDYRQTPQLYIQASSQMARYHSFLFNEPLERSGTFPLVYAEKEQEWRLGAGALHGLNPNQLLNPNKVQVFDIKDPKTQYEAQIKSVFPMHALLSWQQSPPPPQGTYQATLVGLSIPPVAIHLCGDAQGVDLARQGLTGIAAKTASAWFKEVADETQADYVLESRNGIWYTQHPFDCRPLLMPIKYLENGYLLREKAYIPFEDFKQMAKWHYLKNLEHFAVASPDVRPRPDWPIEMRVFEDLGNGTEQRIFPKDRRFLLELTREKPQKALRFELVNHSSQLLYCSLAFMDYHFGFYSDGVMMRPQQGLEQGAVFHSKKVKDSPYLTWGIDDYIKAYHWPVEDNFLKLIFSKTPFNLEQFDMPGLPLPLGKPPKQYRDIMTPKPIPDWEIRTYDFFMVNPFVDFNKELELAMGENIGDKLD